MKNQPQRAMSPIELLKKEFMERYNLTEEQVSIDIRLRGIDKELAEQMGKEYGNEWSSHNYFVGTHCTTVDNKEFKMYIHYPVKEDEEIVID